MESENVHQTRQSFPLNREVAFDRFFEAAPLMMGIADLEGDDIRHVSDNRAAAGFFGVSPEDLKGKLATELGVPREILRKWVSGYKNALKTRTAVTFEYEHPRESDHRIFSVVVSFMEETPAGLPRFAYVVQDVTDARRDRQKLLESNDRLEQIVADRTRDLELQKTKLGCLVESSPLGIAFLDADLRYELVNPVLGRYNGVSPQDHVGRRVEDVLPEHAPLFIERLRDVVSTGESLLRWEYESTTVSEPDVLRSFLASYFPVKLKDEVLGVGAMVFDVTDYRRTRLQLETEKKFLHAILDQIPIAVWIAEAPGGKVILENRVAKTIMTGPPDPARSVAEYTGYKAFHLDGRPFGPTDHAAARALGGETVKAMEFIIERSDGSRGSAVASSVPIRNPEGEIIAAVAVAADVTEKRNAENELRARTNELEEERELREQFVATLSHDLRTPLTAARMSAQIISRKIDITEAVLRSASRIVENMDRADAMIKDLLDVGRIQAGEPLSFEKSACDLPELLSDVLDDLSSIHGDRFRLEAADVTGHWSCKGIRRIVENLCQNAVKYGSPTGPIEVRVRRMGESAEIEVHNEGDPIPEEDVKKLFEPYRRAKSAEGQKRGWGLGLTLVKGITEAHGGTVSVTSSEGAGTSFFVRLPLSDSGAGVSR